VESGLAPNAPHIWQSPSPAELAALLGGVPMLGRWRRQHEHVIFLHAHGHRRERGRRPGNASNAATAEVRGAARRRLGSAG